ncbi:slit homolog 3 protein-like [Cryptotermes secundus]|uniref:slit homolog 3 protein-like n=1 Tax=Cryptotermes secundus TaxID=105785 RepID=UPI000CD7C433|nr:slit homolog 3 protein-like [Cryptotermes secundus]
MEVCFLSAVIFIATLDPGSAANNSMNVSSTDTTPQNEWCPTHCTCALLYRVDCMYVNLGILRGSIFSINSNKIRDLWLDYNNLTRIEINAFNRMELLKRLSLSNNYLRELHPRLFSSLFSLKYLDLRSNCLVSPLHDNLFASLRQLRVLNLDYNKLTTLDPKILTPVSNHIVEITLSNNPFICDCHIREAVEWFNRYKFTSEATCVYPTAGKSWKTLSFNGHCEFHPPINVDLTCKMVSSQEEKDSESSESFSSVLLIVGGICGFLLIVCSGLSLYSCRRANRNTTSSSDRRVNENEDYDDIRSNNYYYYEYVPACVSRNFSTINTVNDAPELPKRSKIIETELKESHKFKRYVDVCDVRSCESESGSYIIPESSESTEQTPSHKVSDSGRSPIFSEALTHSGETLNATE